MKPTVTLILALLISAINFAQNSINYKAIIKDTNGNVVANDLIVVQFAILKGLAQTNVYQETQSPTTNANGMMIVNIGEGTTSDDFSAINWGSDDHYLNVQINTGSGLIDMGTTQFMAVPYALSSGDNYWSKNGEKIYTLNNNTGIGIDDPLAKLDILGGNWNLMQGTQGI
ncbi:hypothetical protein [Xanthomarina sp. GH4-25]|uniref:hypothetical protein n=1 Tax=Xanthomarina sp. GH4-25 TaxID=3349335 RepID=UPI000D6851BC|nr:hypothetical protein DI383_13925 [Flavobacteriaceae bacterium LYZ1037]